MLHLAHLCMSCLLLGSEGHDSAFVSCQRHSHFLEGRFCLKSTRLSLTIPKGFSARWVDVENKWLINDDAAKILGNMFKMKRVAGREEINKKDLNNQRGCGRLESCSQNPSQWGRGSCRDGWVTAWWRRRNKREITLLSLLHFSPLPPSAPRYSSSNYLKETSSLLLTLSLALGCPTGKFCLSDQTDNRSAQHRDTLPLTFFWGKLFFLLNNYNRNDKDDKSKRWCEKENTVEERHFIRCKHDWAQDKEILFWRYAGFRQLGFTLSTAGIHFF